MPSLTVSSTYSTGTDWRNFFDLWYCTT